MQGHADPDRELLDAAALVGHLVPTGSVYAFLGEHRARLFPDELFADLFRSGRGRPSVPGEVIATVLVLQSLEQVSDAAAIDALRTNIKWKVAAGVALDDEGFHPTVLTLWRNRLKASKDPERIFDTVRSVVAETGVLSNKTRRALDSTLLDDAVATQDTVTQLCSVIRRVRAAVPTAAEVVVVGHDYEAGHKPVCAWDDPVARDALVTAMVSDAEKVLAAVEGLDLDDDTRRLVGLLALVAGQDVEEGDEPGSWRIVQKVAKDRVISTVDPESRHMHKSRSVYRDGYKAHLAIEPGTGLITACELTPANVGDAGVGVALLAGEEPGLEVLGDSAYGSGQARADLAAANHVAIIKPKPLARNKRLVDDQLTRDDFVIDYDAETVTCPAEHTVPINAGGQARFGSRCSGCPLRSRCTSARIGRVFSVGEHDQIMAKARSDWAAGIGVAEYRQHRPMVERSIAWLVAGGARRVRYRGVANNHFALTIRVAVLNLRRLINLGLSAGTDGWTLISTQ